jgi:hypothetical protein
MPKKDTSILIMSFEIVFKDIFKVSDLGCKIVIIDEAQKVAESGLKSA